MRKLSPAYVVTTVVIAVAGSAFAQTAARPAGTSVATSGAQTTGAPQVGVNRTSGTANQAITSSTTNGNFTTTTTTNADGTTSTTISNGLTNNSGGVDGSRSGNNTDSSAANTANRSTTANGNATSANANSGSANGSRSGSNTNSSAANSPIGSSSANGATTNGSSSSNGNNTDTNNRVGTAGSVVVPGIFNSTTGAVSSDGERLDDTRGNNQSNGNAPMQNNGSAGASIEAEAARSSKNLDRAIQQVERDRKKIGRNGQLLQSIAPRTGADRSNEMPDDGPSPALTGSSSALTRR